MNGYTHQPPQPTLKGMQFPHVRRTVGIPAPHLVDDQEDMFSLQDTSLPVEAERKFQMLEERVKVMEGHNIHGLDITDLGLVLGIKIPAKFKAPDFDKYKGTTCIKTHI